MTFDSGFVVMLLIPVFAGLIAIGFFILSGFVGSIKDLFNG